MFIFLYKLGQTLGIRDAYREDKRRRKADAQFNMRLGAASPWESDDDRYLHAYSQTSEEDITEEESDDEE